MLALWPPAAFGRPTDPRICEARLTEEGLPAGDAETARLAHALAGFLESAYAREAREDGAEIVADETLLWSASTQPPAPTPRRDACSFRGTRDLRLTRASGARVDVLLVSAERAEAALAACDLVLRAAALAEARAAPEAEVRAGVISLAGAGAAPAWLRGGLGAEAHARFEEEVAALAHRVAEARFEDRFEGIARARCVRLGCGFVGACHGEGDRRDARP